MIVVVMLKMTVYHDVMHCKLYHWKVNLCDYESNDYLLPHLLSSLIVQLLKWISTSQQEINVVHCIVCTYNFFFHTRPTAKWETNLTGNLCMYDHFHKTRKPASKPATTPSSQSINFMWKLINVLRFSHRRCVCACACMHMCQLWNYFFSNPKFY